MTVNRKRQEPLKDTKMIKDAHLNFMGGPSYDVKNPILRLMCMSASSFFGEPMYYKGQSLKSGKKTNKLHHTAQGSCITHLSDREKRHLLETLDAIDDYSWRRLSPQKSMERAIDEALSYDIEKTLEWAVTLRKEEYIRVTPQVILVRAANNPKAKGTGLVRRFGAEIIQRADEPATQMAYQMATFGKPIPNSLKRAWSDYFLKASDYSLAKYRMENRVVKTVDVARMAFGNGVFGFDLPIGKLARGELVLGEQIRTWESILSGGGSWEKAIEVMGHMALLRNIRNLLENNVPTKLWLDKLVATAKRGKQLPFRYLTAYQFNSKAPGNVLDAIEECLMLSINNLPRIPGRVLTLSDNSGSTHGTPISELSKMTVAQIGNLMSVLTGMAADEGVSGVFGDKLSLVNVRKRSSVFDQVKNLNSLGKRVGANTENGIWLALDKAIKEKSWFDSIFVYSDMQAGHGGLYGVSALDYKNYIWPKHTGTRYIDVPKLISTYRNVVNPKVNVFLVQIAGYEDTLLPEYYNRTFIIGGWSSSILQFASSMIHTMDLIKQ